MLLLKKVLDRLFSTSAAGLYILLFAISIGVATFVENDFGTSSAQKVIFKSRWFEAIVVLFSISLVVNIFRFRLIQQKKWATLTFHAAMVVIVIGAGVTRYFGSEGMMGIREGSASDSFLSAETYLKFQFISPQGKKSNFDEPVLFATLGDNHFEQSYLIGNQELKVEVEEFVPNPKEVLEDDPTGVPVIKIVIGGAGGREEFLVKKGDKTHIYGTLFNFGNAEDPQAFNIRYDNGNLEFRAATPFAQMVMATQTRDTLAPGLWHPLRLRSLYSNGRESFVFGDFKPAARTAISSESRKMTSTSTGGLRMKVNLGGEEQQVFVTGAQGDEGSPKVARFQNGAALAVAYGARRVTLPFSIQLRDFIMERYPGTENASSYASEVTLLDSRSNLSRNERIYMNNILDYDGYRFFQSSFDKDELGTYLSVNHDAPGTWISYLGYFLLTLGMALTLFDRKSRSQQLAENIRRAQKPTHKLATLLIAALVGLASPAFAEPANPKVSSDHAARFGRILMQDHKGRLKPMNTYASEILRKIARKESLLGLSAEQVVLGMAVNPEDWYDVPMLKIGKHEEIRNLLKISGDMASYSDFFGQNGEYKLKEAVRGAYNMPPRDRGVLEKELVKLDEKVNICSMVYSGRFLKVFPMPGDTSNTWLSPIDVPHQHGAAGGGGSIVEQFYPMYVPALQNALKSNDWSYVNRMLAELEQYQQRYGGAILPSQSTVEAELLLNKLNIFSRLTGLYGLLGLAFLGLLFTKDVAHLMLPKPMHATIRVCDIAGCALRTMETDGGELVEIPVGGLPTATYLVQVVLENGQTWVGKMQVE